MAGIEKSGEKRIAQALNLLALMEQNKPAKRVWEYDTNPRHIFDKVLWPLLRPLMLIAAQGKISHWWHWIDLPDNISLDGQELKGDPSAFSLDSRFALVRRFQATRMSLGGWQTAYVIGPDKSNLSSKELAEGWRYAFQGLGDDQRRSYCSIILHGSTRILAGPDNFIVGGLEAHSFNQIPLIAAGPFPNRVNLPIV